MNIATSLSTLPHFLLYFATAVMLTAVFPVLYANLTPHREIRLIRDGNIAAALALVGGLLGLSFRSPASSATAPR